jgi:hypothetical protein
MAAHDDIFARLADAGLGLAEALPAPALRGPPAADLAGAYRRLARSRRGRGAHHGLLAAAKAGRARGVPGRSPTA